MPGIRQDQVAPRFLMPVVPAYIPLPTNQVSRGRYRIPNAGEAVLLQTGSGKGLVHPRGQISRESRMRKEDWNPPCRGWQRLLSLKEGG